MRFSKYKIILLGLLITGSCCLTGCKATKPTVITKSYKETITETVHDTVFEIAADSSAYKALLECQNGKVVIKEIVKNVHGKHMNIPAVTIKDNQLSVDCLAEAQRLLAQWKSKEITKSLFEQQPIYIEFEPSFWERFLMGFGKFSLVILVIGLTVWITKKQITAFRLKN